MKKYIRVPVGLVDVSTREGWDRSLAYWFLCKANFQNSCLYGYSLRRLASVMDCSHECARFHYNIWIEQGVVRHTNGNLTFCGLDETVSVALRNITVEKKSCKKIININIATNVADQLKTLKARCVLKNINQQLRNIKVNREAVQILSLAEKNITFNKAQHDSYKKAIKRANLMGEKRLKSYNKNVSLSDNGIAKLLGCSLSYAKQLKAFMNKAGLITAVKEKGSWLQKIRLYDFLLAKEYSNSFEKAFWFKGHAYSYPKTVYSVGSTCNSSWYNCKD